MVKTLLDGNKRFVKDFFDKEKEFFNTLLKGQTPSVLWIGCSDSRVPVTIITNTRPGEVFVHRNIANIVSTNDWNMSAVLEFSITRLNIPDIVVCGHYGCGGINAIDEYSENDKYIALWLSNAVKAREAVDKMISDNGLILSREKRLDYIVEENVRVQVRNLLEYPFVIKATQEKTLNLHGWVYDMSSGEIKVIETRYYRNS